MLKWTTIKQYFSSWLIDVLTALYSQKLLAWRHKYFIALNIDFQYERIANYKLKYIKSFFNEMYHQQIHSAFCVNNSSDPERCFISTYQIEIAKLMKIRWEFFKAWFLIHTFKSLITIFLSSWTWFFIVMIMSLYNHLHTLTYLGLYMRQKE